ncbi:MAG: hypothetical protein WC073_08645 [Sterolibacterium sp.]
MRKLCIDAHTAVITTVHAPKVDDMALLEALKSDAFDVGSWARSGPRPCAECAARNGVEPFTVEKAS